MTRTGIINAAFSTPGLKRDRAVYLSLLMVVLRVIMPALFIFMFYKLYLPGELREAISDMSIYDLIMEMLWLIMEMLWSL